MTSTEEIANVDKEKVTIIEKSGVQTGTLSIQNIAQYSSRTKSGNVKHHKINEICEKIKTHGINKCGKEYNGLIKNLKCVAYTLGKKPALMKVCNAPHVVYPTGEYILIHVSPDDKSLLNVYTGNDKYNGNDKNTTPLSIEPTTSAISDTFHTPTTTSNTNNTNTSIELNHILTEVNHGIGKSPIKQSTKRKRGNTQKIGDRYVKVECKIPGAKKSKINKLKTWNTKSKVPSIKSNLNQRLSIYLQKVKENNKGVKLPVSIFNLGKDISLYKTFIKNRENLNELCKTLDNVQCLPFSQESQSLGGVLVTTVDHFELNMDDINKYNERGANQLEFINISRKQNRAINRVLSDYRTRNVEGVL